MSKVEWLDRSLLVCPYFCLCLNEKAYKQALKRMKVPRDHWGPFLQTHHAHATTHYLEKGDGSLACIVCMGSTEGRDIPTVHGLLVHEAVHIWQQYREFIGEKSPSSEFEAYSIQWISRMLIESYLKQTEGKKS